MPKKGTGMKRDIWVAAAAAVCFCIGAGSLAAYGDDYTTWANSCKIVLNTSATGANVATNQTGFPVLVRLTKSNFSFSQAMSGGKDVRFSKSNGAHIPYQIERWDSTNGLAEIWVKADTVYGNNSSQYLKMYWGKSGAIDSSNGGPVFDTANAFTGVWHFNTPGTGKRPDATFYSDSAKPIGASFSQAGVIGGCDTFSAAIAGNNSYDSVANAANSINLANRNFTLMAWCKMDSIPDTGATGVNHDRHFMGLGKPAPDSGLQMEYIHAGKYSFRFYNDDLDQTNPYTGGKTWHLVAGTFNATTKAQILYYDGAMDNSRTASHTFAGTGALIIGKSFWQTWDGSLDEVVVSDTDRSADWIKLCYASQNPTASWSTLAPIITAQPRDTTLSVGQTATFTVGATGAGLSYQWQSGSTWSNVSTGSGGATSSYTTASVSPSDNGTRFRCIIANAAGSDTSYGALLTVNSPCTSPTSSNPANLGVAAGATATFSVTAGGSAPFHYQWQDSGASAGAAWANAGIATGAVDTLATLSFVAQALQNGTKFKCSITNGCGNAVSGAAILSVCSPVKILSQPGSDSVTVGDTATFSATATGDAPISYQWQRGGGPWTNVTAGIGGTTGTYKLATLAADNGAKFRLVVQNSCGGISTDSSAAVTVAVCSPPVITANPQNCSDTLAGSASFSVTATGTSLTYQWQKSGDGQVWNDIASATSFTYTIASAGAGDDGMQFRCNVSGKCGSVANSTAARLSVCVPLKIVGQPSGSTSVLAGKTVRFLVTAQGTAVKYLWQKSAGGGTFASIAGDTLDSLSFAAAPTDSGSAFRCIVSGQCGLTDTIGAGILQVFTPVHAAFGASTTAGLVPLTVAFTDSSTGTFTKRTWNFGDGTVDSSGNKSVNHNFAGRQYLYGAACRIRTGRSRLGVETDLCIRSGCRPHTDDGIVRFSYKGVRNVCKFFQHNASPAGDPRFHRDMVQNGRSAPDARASFLS